MCNLYCQNLSNILDRMSQKFHVLRCYKCRTFQSHMVKKSNKWDCKVCGDRQSLQGIFGSGTGKECRLHVQKLNIQQMHAEQEVSRDMSPAVSVHIVTCDQSSPDHSPTGFRRADNFTSKWTKYVTAPSVVNDDSQSDDFEFVVETMGRVPPKKRKLNNKNSRHSINTEENDSSLLCKDQAFIEDFSDAENLFLDNQCEKTDRFNVNDDICDIPQISDNKHRSVTDRTTQVTSKWTKYLVETIPPDQSTAPLTPKASERPAFGDSKHSLQIFDSFLNDELFTLDDVLHV